MTGGLNLWPCEIKSCLQPATGAPAVDPDEDNQDEDTSVSAPCPAYSLFYGHWCSKRGST